MQMPRERNHQSDLSRWTANANPHDWHHSKFVPMMRQGWRHGRRREFGPVSFELLPPLLPTCVTGAEFATFIRSVDMV
ncbi:hypothetical protein LshimejAT787_0108940 [Lyophyllum shimeji]|uniref:Uncharacterized protein n=1 Tax=Lyophyllum shimeji TaxID=47721 RepID=A0A9P3PDF0_LYOSH|nr:hypothetical protein LshimejAT787_0108940 [Lyophyllum shimeji]